MADCNSSSQKSKWFSLHFVGFRECPLLLGGEGGDEVAGDDGRADDAGNIRPHSVHKKVVVWIGFPEGSAA